MDAAFLRGFVAGSSLLIGGFLALELQIGRIVLGLVMAFGAGVLISAVAYNLIEEAVQTSAGGGGVALGLAAGAFAFYLGDLFLDRSGGEAESARAASSPRAHRSASSSTASPSPSPSGSHSSREVGSASRSSRPCSCRTCLSRFAATTGLAESGWARARILGLWGLVALASALAAVVGYTAFGDASPRTLAFVLAFAGGAILTMLADTMMPEAFEHGGKRVGLARTRGFGLALGLTAVG